jgi:hypothetical protein
MKKLLLALLVLAGITSCSESEDPIEETTKPLSNENFMMFEYGATDEYHIQEIDGCEYILVNGMNNHEPALTHKGNCKYCAERSQITVDSELRKEDL